MPVSGGVSASTARIRSSESGVRWSRGASSTGAFTVECARSSVFDRASVQYRLVIEQKAEGAKLSEALTLARPRPARIQFRRVIKVGRGKGKFSGNDRQLLKHACELTFGWACSLSDCWMVRPCDDHGSGGQLEVERHCLETPPPHRECSYPRRSESAQLEAVAGAGLRRWRAPIWTATML